MEKVVTFNKTGYDPFIDFIKAYAILCVLLGHTFPYLDETGYCLWYGMQVPMFVLVQVFHVFKKDNPTFSFNKICTRILMPYILVQLGLFLIFAIFSQQTVKSLIIGNIIRGGGTGPGSYYPWVYIQLALLLPIVKPWLEKCSRLQEAIIMVAICECFEILSSVCNLPEWLHRLLAIRYFFLIYLGYLWVKDGIVVNCKTIILSVISMGSIIYFEYFDIDSEPWFYTTGWETHRWPCYFYVSTLLCYLLYLIYNRTKQSILVTKATRMLARCSYEIFLMQMAIISVCPSMNFIDDHIIRFGVRFTFIWVVSIVGGYYFNILYGKFLRYYKV